MAVPYFFVFAALSFLSSCNKGDLPTVLTAEIAGITTNSVSIGGNVTDDGGDAVSARGVVWHTSENQVWKVILV